MKENTIQDLVKEAEQIYNKRETVEERDERLRKESEEREVRRDRRRDKELSRLLATVVSGQRQGRQKRDRRGPRVDKDQCAYCKEKGHWIKDCPNRPKGPRRPRPQTSLLSLAD